MGASLNQLDSHLRTKTYRSIEGQVQAPQTSSNDLSDGHRDRSGSGISIDSAT
jgi:hypothetical protein